MRLFSDYCKAFTLRGTGQALQCVELTENTEVAFLLAKVGSNKLDPFIFLRIEMIKLTDFK